MIRRRNYFSISMMMLVLLCMFMILQVYKDKTNEYNKNSFVQENELTEESAWKSEAINLADNELNETYVLFVGKENGSVAESVKQWCEYTKNNLVIRKNLSTFEGEIGEKQQYLMIEGSCFDVEEEIGLLEEFAKQGVKIVFCNLPDVRDINESQALKDLLGIRQVQEYNIQASGIRLFSGFLLGGEVIYEADPGDEEEQERQDFNLEMPWYLLGEGTETYMVGLLDEEYRSKNVINWEMLPALLWKHTNKQSTVFAVNGDYIGDNGGVGILSAISAQMEKEYLYPIVDAQVLTIANFPSMAKENDKVMKQLFSSNMIQVNRDIILPQFRAITEQTDFQATYMMTPQYIYGDLSEPLTEPYELYQRTIKEANAEIGLAMTTRDETTISEKIEIDKKFWNETDGEYQFNSLYVNKQQLEELLEQEEYLQGFSTIVCEKKLKQPWFSYVDENVLVQRTTNDLIDHSYSDNMLLRSMQTALGYSNVLMDMERVLWPEEEQLPWEELSKNAARYLDSYWAPYQQFEDTTASESDRKIREFLALDYEYEREGDVITAEIENMKSSASFILRTHGETIKEIVGASYELIENEIFLIRATEPTIEIRLEKNVFADK